MKTRFLPLLAVLAAAGCTSEPSILNSGLEDSYQVERMTKLRLAPELTGAEYRWTLTEPDGSQSVVAATKDYIFLAEKEGHYGLQFEIIDPETPYKSAISIDVVHEEVEYSPYISRVYEYCPAPGQFVNEMPRWEQGDTYADILQKVEESIGGTNDELITLGGYGGYVTFGFDHTVVNVSGKADFRVWGNCFYKVADSPEKGGSAEPGIVMVSYDTNCNGEPDDPWFELAGSEYHSPATLHDYSITYTRAEGDITWRDSQGIDGAVSVNMFHTQPYWPQWLDEDEMTFAGTRLADNAVDTSGRGSRYVLYSYPWGYADNHPNEYADLNSFNIDNAVDSNGNSVKLPGVDFVRVYTGVNQSCGWLGETSTELSRAQDLHIDIQ